MAPAVFFASDYGAADEFVGVVHAVLHRLAPAATVIDLSHEIAPYDVAAGAGLLARCAPHLGPGVVLAVVDPGVGTGRRGVALRLANAGRLHEDAPTWMVGPDNGLLLEAADLLGGVERAVVLAQPGEKRPDGRVPTGPTFDGRDVFAPSAAHLATGGTLGRLGPDVDPTSLVRVGAAAGVARWETSPTGPVLVARVLAVDRFGNAMLDIDAGTVDALGVRPGADALVEAAGGAGEAERAIGSTDPVLLRRVRTFADLGVGTVGLIVDSSGAMALVMNRASAARRLGLAPGAAIRLRAGVPPAFG